MSSTNKTTYYELPQFVDSDLFNPLVDDNDAYAKIDTALHQIADAEADDASEIVSIKGKVTTAEGKIEALETQNGSEVLSTTAQTLSGAVNELDNDISSLDGRLDLVEDDINNVNTGIKAKIGALEIQTDKMAEISKDNNGRSLCYVDYNGICVTNYAGINVNYYKTTLMDILSFYGFNSVGLVLPMYQTDLTTNDVANTHINKDDLHEVCKFLIDKGIKVTLQFHAEVHDGTWRARIVPSNLTTWFANYTNALVPLCAELSDINIDSIEIASEMTGISKNDSHWIELVNSIKSVIDAGITYGFDMSAGRGVELNYTPLIDKLDFISVHFYPFVNRIINETNTLTVDEILTMLETATEEYASPSTVTYINEIQSFYNKKLVISEYGGGFNHSVATSPNVYNYYKALTIFFNKFVNVSGKFAWGVGYKPTANDEQFAVADTELRNSISKVKVGSVNSPAKIYRTTDYGVENDFVAVMTIKKNLLLANFRAELKTFDDRTNNTSVVELRINKTADNIILESIYTGNDLPLYHYEDTDNVYIGFKRDNETSKQYYLMPLYVSHIAPVSYSEVINDLKTVTPTRMTYKYGANTLKSLANGLVPQYEVLEFEQTDAYETVTKQLSQGLRSDGEKIIFFIAPSARFQTISIVGGGTILNGGTNSTLGMSGALCYAGAVNRTDVLQFNLQYNDAGTRYAIVMIIDVPVIS